jgi:hypothetical protein
MTQKPSRVLLDRSALVVVAEILSCGVPKRRSEGA